MRALIITIQEITLQAYEFKIYKYLQDRLGWGRDQIFDLFQDWGKEFEEAHKDYEWDGDYYDEIDLFLRDKKRELRD